MLFLTRASLQTFRKVILIAAIVLAMMQIIGAENIAATNIVLDANGNRVEHPGRNAPMSALGSPPKADMCSRLERWTLVHCPIAENQLCSQALEMVR